MSIEERVPTLNPSGAGVNCFGTALYLCGLRNDEAEVKSPEFAAAVSGLRKEGEPKLGDIICFVAMDGAMPTHGDYLHAGIITSVEPLLMAHRRDYNGRPESDVNVMEYREHSAALRRTWLIFAKTKAQIPAGN